MVNENGLAKTVGQISFTANPLAGFNTDISIILGIAALNSAMGGTPSHDSTEDGFRVQIMYNHKNWEKYIVTVKRDSITLSWHKADTIVTAIETWVDACSGGIIA